MVRGNSVRLSAPSAVNRVVKRLPFSEVLKALSEEFRRLSATLPSQAVLHGRCRWLRPRPNCQSVFRIERIPSDNSINGSLDGCPPMSLTPYSSNASGPCPIPVP